MMTGERKKGIISTIIFNLAVVLLLLLLGLKTEPTQTEDGIVINFGTSQDGLGAIEPPEATQPENVTAPSAQPKTQSVASSTQQGEEIMQQNFEESAQVESRNQQEKKEKELKEQERKKQLEQERLRKQQEEKDRLAREEQERIQREEQERLAREEQQRQMMNNLAKNAFSGKNPNQTNTTGEGVTQGNTNQGDPNGTIDSQNRSGDPGHGISFTLTGRKASSLPKPQYTVQKEGKVVVEIFVDRNGNVVDAIPGKKGSTTTDAQLYEEARKAALKAKFDSNPNAPDRQKGEITYIFLLN